MENYIDKEKQNPAGCRISLTGCFTLILAAALTAIAVKECKRSELRLKRDQANYEYFQDSIKGAQR